MAIYLRCFINFGLGMFQVKSLEGHIDPIDVVMAQILDKLNTPLSSVDPEDFAEFISQSKSECKDADVDMKDARRRISSAKGPRAKKQVVVENDDNESDGEGSVSA